MDQPKPSCLSDDDLEDFVEDNPFENVSKNKMFTQEMQEIQDFLSSDPNCRIWPLSCAGKECRGMKSNFRKKAKKYSMDASGRYLYYEPQSSKG